MTFAEEIDLICKTCAKDEIFNLTSQIRRASDFIALNISEDSILQSALEFKRFLGFSIQSLAEVVTWL